MPLLFLLIAACLVLLALLFILPPLWRPASNIKTANDERNIEIAKQRLAELKEQLQANVLTKAQYDEQRAELEQALSDDLTLKSVTLDTTTQGRGLSFFLLVAIPIIAISLYAVLGNFAAVNPTPEMIAGDKPALPDQATINKMVDGLAAKMKADPKNAEGWLMLGKSYKYLEQYDKAADAFGKAYELLSDKPDVMLAYAEALAFANQQQITGKSAELIFKALKIAPDNPNALWLAGMAKTQTGEFNEAKNLWSKLAATMQQGSEEYQAIQELLSNVDKKIAETANGINLTVSIAPELKAEANDTVFIYAQAENNKMPLAIVRKTVRDLPITVTLSDALAMIPDNKLSLFKTVKLLARVSKSGNPMPQTGDFIGTIENVSVTDKKTHTLIINNIMK
ncbi:Cytochrome c-type biogenesis protein CcmH [Patescibacteria group bacterium]|nr:Cytochrome c-type biogenesis protein CcmH [Patescibacteria group bacterium]